MRTDLIGGLLDVAAHNLARGADRLAAFESGRVYLPQAPPAEGGALGGRFRGARPSPIAEPHRLAAVLIGPLAAADWRGEPKPADFYDAKGLLELLFSALGVEATFSKAAGQYLHPARAANV